MNDKLVCVVNSQTSNLSSLTSALKYLKIKYKVINKYNSSINFTHLILPGVGSFGYVMQNLIKNKLDKLIYESNFKKKKILGICLGMQLLFESSTESKSSKGLGLIKGDIKKFKKKYKSPHIGFNYVYHDGKDIWKGIKNPSPFYFVHSYKLCKVKEKNLKIYKSEFGEKFVSFVKKENIYGAQFHPEKSHKFGLQLLKNFLYEV